MTSIFATTPSAKRSLTYCHPQNNHSDSNDSSDSSDSSDIHDVVFV